MFTSMALNQDNIVKIGPGPPLPTKVPVEADVIVGRAHTDIFATAPIPGVSSGGQVMRARLTRGGGVLVRSELACADAGSGARVIVTGVLEFAVTYRRGDGLVGFTRVRLPLSTFVDLPGVRFREDMQAEVAVSVTTAILDAPPGPTLGGLVRLDVVVTRDEIIVLMALPPARMSP